MHHSSRMSLDPSSKNHKANNTEMIFSYLVIISTALYLIFITGSCRSEVSKNPNDSENKVQNLILEARRGNGSSVRRLLSLSDGKDIDLDGSKIRFEELVQLLHKTAKGGDSESQLLAFKYLYLNPEYRFDGWQSFLRQSFLGGNNDAGFLLLLFSLSRISEEYFFDDADLDLAKNRIETERKNEPRDPFRDLLQDSDFEEAYRNFKNSSLLEDLNFSDRATELLGDFKTLTSSNP